MKKHAITPLSQPTDVVNLILHSSKIMRIVRSHQDDCGEIIVLSGDGIPHEIRIEKNGKSLVGFSIEPDGRITITDYAHARHKIFVDSNRTLYPDATWDGSMGW